MFSGSVYSSVCLHVRVSGSVCAYTEWCRYTLMGNLCGETRIAYGHVISRGRARGPTVDEALESITCRWYPRVSSSIEFIRTSRDQTGGDAHKKATVREWIRVSGCDACGSKETLLARMVLSHLAHGSKTKAPFEPTLVVWLPTLVAWPRIRRVGPRGLRES